MQLRRFTIVAVPRLAPVITAAALLAACAHEAKSDPAGSSSQVAAAVQANGAPSATGGPPAANRAQDAPGNRVVPLYEWDSTSHHPDSAKGDSTARGAKTPAANKSTSKNSNNDLDPHRYIWRGTPPKPAFAVKPLPGAILPYKRFVVYYGNPYSKRMGVLGEYPIPEMLSRLQGEVRAFQQADPATPVQPGLHLIVTVAQGAPGKDGMYRLRMGDSLITAWCDLAAKNNMAMFLDVQVGQSTVQAELPRLEPYLKRPYVHLALDPEFSMHHGAQGIVPGKKIGVMDAAEVNYAAQFLDRIVRENHLPPKVLVVHRFTQKMLTNYRDIRPLPTVQVLINMDGFGPPWLKRDSYNDYERMQPVQWTGFKLFYKNDHPMLTRKEVVALKPAPLFITFQ